MMWFIVIFSAIPDFHLPWGSTLGSQMAEIILYSASDHAPYDAHCVKTNIEEVWWTVPGKKS